ncbi:MAG: N-acetyltransferase [Flavobacterium sp.]|nr:MAG: N-acetyltransferase [Flavobacterium sp.]
MTAPIKNYSVVNTTHDDLLDICRMFEAAIAYQKRNNYPGWNSFDKVFLEAEIDKKLQLKIVQDENILCVFSICFRDPLIWREMDTGTAIYLHRITVNPKFKGQRQFAKVLDWAVEYARENRLETIRMDTWANNPQIISYYMAYGFRFVGNYTTPDTSELPEQHRNLTVSLLELRCDDYRKNERYETGKMV